jgi:hypothetical protein
MEHNKKNGLFIIENIEEGKKAFDAGFIGLRGIETQATKKLKTDYEGPFPIVVAPPSTTAIIKGLNILAGVENPAYDYISPEAQSYLKDSGIELRLTGYEI